MCMHSVTPVSLQTWKTASHSPLWIVGSFKWWGISLKQKARDNFAAIGAAIIGIFVVSWVVSTAIYKLRRYDELEAVTPVP